MTIGALAKATSTTAETIRWYERKGILPAPVRTGTGRYRTYVHSHLERLAFVRRCRALGFTLDEVRDLLALADQSSRDCGEVNQIARNHLSSIESRIADLERLAAELRQICKRCEGGVIADCRIIKALNEPFRRKTPGRKS